MSADIITVSGAREVKSEEREPYVVHCATCSHEWTLAYTPMNLTAFARVLGNAHCPMCGASSRTIFHGPIPRPVADGDWMGWMQGSDTGTSSKTIWSVMTGRTVTTPPDIPYDPSDFGRCYRLLKVMPAWRSRLHEVADAYPQWAPFVAHWDELTALYEEEIPGGTAPKCYGMMLACRRAGDGGTWA